MKRIEFRWRYSKGCLQSQNLQLQRIAKSLFNGGKGFRVSDAGIVLAAREGNGKTQKRAQEAVADSILRPFCVPMTTGADGRIKLRIVLFLRIFVTICCCILF